MGVLLTYEANNSGGRWWLKDKDWLALEAAGWEVVWGGHVFCHSNDKRKTPPICATKNDCHGHRAFESFKDMKKDDYWLGAAAREASKRFDSVRQGVEEWARITGQSQSDGGCPCCGPPHNFTVKRDDGTTDYLHAEATYHFDYGE